jgi:hypothetical protein
MTGGKFTVLTPKIHDSATILQRVRFVSSAELSLGLQEAFV